MFIKVDKSSWTKVKLGNVAYRKSGSHTLNAEDKGLYIGLEHMTTDSYSILSFGSETEIAVPKTPVEPGDILFARRNTYLRRVANCPIDGFFSPDGYAIRSKSKDCLQEYLFWVIASNSFLDFSIKWSAGTHSKRVKWTDLEKYEFLLPPIDIQVEIANLFWALQAHEGASVKLEIELRNTWKAFEKLLFERVDSECTLGSIAEINGHNTIPKEVSEPFRYIDISSVTAEENIELENLATYTFPEAPSRAQRQVKAGDFVVSTVRPLQKSIALVPLSKQNLIASSGLAVLQAKNTFSHEYLEAILFGDFFAKAMQAKSTGTSYPAIRPKDIKEFRIPNPDLHETQHRVQRINQLRTAILKIKTERKSLRVLNSILLSEIFTEHLLDSSNK
jgi:type I restriction enzyme S subunit